MIIIDIVTYALAKKYADKVVTGSSITVPTKTSDLQNDSGFVTDTQVTTKVNTHNTSTSAHTDIRSLITSLTTKLNALADSDDTTLDQMSEVVAYIKNNKSLIDGITTSKVNVSDVVNNLTSNVTNKPLSAAQGVVLKGLIDTLTDSKVSTTELNTAVNSALATAKAGGDFKGDKGDKGDTGSAGKNGTSVAVSDVLESTADGGSNVVTFSDGKTVTIKNGSKGSTGATGAKGADGASVKAIAFTKDADGNIVGGTATLSDSSTIAITVTTVETSE